MRSSPHQFLDSRLGQVPLLTESMTFILHDIPLGDGVTEMQVTL